MSVIGGRHVVRARYRSSSSLVPGGAHYGATLPGTLLNSCIVYATVKVDDFYFELFDLFSKRKLLFFFHSFFFKGRLPSRDVPGEDI